MWQHTQSRFVNRLLGGALGVWACLLAGCAAGNLLGGMAQNFEYQKKIQVLPKYEGLEHKTVAVVVNADLATLYEFPGLTMTISTGISARINEYVDGTSVVDPRIIQKWQYQTPQWNALPYGDLVEQLNVDRVVYVDLYEWRLHPPGNQWMWDGVAAANIGIIERDGIMPDIFSDEFSIISEFPAESNITRDGANENQIRTGLLAEFIKETSWLFYEHLEPKYPDKYRPELDRPARSSRSG